MEHKKCLKHFETTNQINQWGWDYSIYEMEVIKAMFETF